VYNITTGHIRQAEYIFATFSTTVHVEQILSVANQRQYLLQQLKCQGLSRDGLHIIFSAIVLSVVTYALPSFAGQLSIGDKERINNSNYWYQQFEFWISAIVQNCRYRHFPVADISNSNCRYRQFELWISTIVDIHISNCRYQQFELWISAIPVVDISSCAELSILTIPIADVDNSNCRYQQFELRISAIMNKS